MDPILGGSLISAGSKLLGSLFGGSNDDTWDHTKTLAKNQIQWKVADAKAAGVSPLYALGAPTMSYSGSVGGEPSLGSTLSDMGQDIGRAVAAKQTAPERAVQALVLEKAGLENEYLREQIASIRARTWRESAPPLPLVNPPKEGMPLSTKGDMHRPEKFMDSQGNTVLNSSGTPASVVGDWWGDEIGSELWGIDNMMKSYFDTLIRDAKSTGARYSKKFGYGGRSYSPRGPYRY